jgi:two-component system, cell cycle sensor histidine kinase and response regulator CckA
MKIQTRIIGAVMLVVAVVTVVFSVYLFNKERTAARAELSATIKNNKTLLKVVTAGPLYDGNVEQLDAILDSLFTNPDIVQIELTEFNGNIRLHRTRTPATMLGETITSHIVISRSIDDLGEINITYSTALLEVRLLQSRNQIVLFSVILVVGLSGVIYLVAKGLTGPIERLTAAARDMASGHLDREINASGAVELESLGQSFIRMRDAIREKMTDLEARNEAFRVSEDRLNQAVRASQIGIFDHNHLTDTIYWSPQQRQIYGWGPDDPVTLSKFINQVHLEDRERIAAAVRRAHDPAGDGLFDVEHRIMRRDGVVRWITTRSQTYFEGEGDARHLVRTVGGVIDITERKRGEEEQQKLVSIIENSFDLIGIADLDGNLLYLNAAGRSLVGLDSLEDVRNQSVRTFHLEEDYRTFETTIFPSIMQFGRWTGETAYRNFKTGASVPVEMSAFMIRNQSTGQPIALANISRDITERKRVEAALRESRNLLQTIFDTIPARIFWKDRELRYLGCNRPFAFDAGVHSPDEITGKDDYQMGWREQAELYRSDDRKVLETGTPKLNYEEPQTTPDGRRIWLRTNKVPLKNADGTIWGVLGTYEDITEYKKAEVSLLQAALIVENSPVMLFRWKAAEGWPIVLVSQNVLQLGYTPEELLKESKRFASMVHPDDLERIAQEVQTYTASGIDRFHQEYRIFAKDGQVRWIDDRTVVERDDTGRVTHYQGIVVDITDQKLAEQEREKLQSQLNHAQRMESIGRLAGGVAHDFNNMLSVILGYATMMKGKLSGTDPLMQYLQEIEYAAVRSRDLTSQLLAFSRKQVIDPKVVNLNNLIKSMQNALTRMIGEDVELRVIFAERLWNIKIDPMQVDQIIMNLAVNARDAMPNGGSLTIETANVQLDEAYCRQHAGSRPGSFVLLTVSDNGSGMSKEIQSHIFEPFFTTKEFGKGTGLGLATVYGIVRQNDGFINVYSEVGQGTSFKIYLPRTVEETALAGAPSPVAAAAPAGAGTILLVEDDAMVRELALLLLKTLGYSVLVANSPAHALSLCERKELAIELLMTDVVMPGMNGKELFRKVSAIRPGIKVLFMSGYTANVIAHHGVLDEGIKFIQKPFSIDDLAQKVQDAIRGGA